MTRIVVTSDVRPSEDLNKVLNSIANFFTYDKMDIRKEGIIQILVLESSTLKSLLKLHRALRNERILDSARKYLFKGIEGNSINFMIHKQAAAIGVLSFVDSDNESPLGAINFYIQHSNPQLVIDWLAPKTSHGVPLWDNPIPSDD
ncbi:MAG: RNA-binding domain-containing protein [Saccharolobus sp.]